MSRDMKSLAGIGLALLRAGLGYAAFESIDVRNGGDGSPSRSFDDDGIKQHVGHNTSANLWDNFKQFYVGLTGFTFHEKKS